MPPEEFVPDKGPSPVSKGKSKSRATRTVVAPSEQRLTEDEICGAHTQRGNKCRQRKGSRTDHPGYGNCAKHGGNTEAGIKSAMREMGRDLAQRYKREYMRFGGDRHQEEIATMTPESALLEEVRRSAAMVRFLEERIAAWNLTPISDEWLEKFAASPDKNRDPRAPSMNRYIDELFQSLPHEDPESPNHLPALTEVHAKTGITSFTDAREWLLLYREERGHLARVSKMCIDAGVAQRLVSIAEDQGRILSSAIRAVLLALDLTPAQQDLIPRVVPPILRAVATDQPIPDVKQMLALSAG